MLAPKNYNGEVISFFQRKADGIRVFIERKRRFTAKTRSEKQDLWPVIEKMYGDVLYEAMPENSALDCELHAGTQSTEVSHLIASNQFAKLDLSCFAIPFWNGKDLAFSPISEVMSISPIPFVLTYCLDQVSAVDPDKLLSMYSLPNDEGLVLKRWNYCGWWKLKRKHTIDVIVTGYETSESVTYFGGLKSIRVGLTDGSDLGTIGTGFDSQFRLECDKESLIGRVAEIECDGLAAAGKLRFGRFIRWRDDKPASECSAEQLKHFRR